MTGLSDPGRVAPPGAARAETADRHSARVGWLLDATVTVALTALAGVSAARHALWRDEVQAWAIAAASASPADLLSALRYEGHPPLWYVVLTPVTWLTDNPRSMLVVTVALFAMTALLVLRTAPWSRLMSVALLAGYFPIYEFTAIARSYSLGMALTFALCAAAWPSAGARRWPLVGLLAVLTALTSAPNACIAVAVVAGLMVDEAQCSPERGWRALIDRPVGGTLVAAASVVGLGAFLVRPADGVVVPSRDSSSDPLSLLVSQVARTLNPTPDIRRSWWTSNWAVENLGRWPAGAAALVLVCALLWVLRRSVPALVVVTTGIGMVVVVGIVTGIPVLHVSGNLFLAVVAAVWCYLRSSAGTDEWGDAARPVRRVFGVVLGLQLVATAVTLPQAWTTTFSGLEATAHNLRDMRSGVVAAEPEAQAGALAGMLGRPVYVPSAGRDQRYTVWDGEGAYRPGTGPSDAEIVVAARERAAGRPSVLVLDHPVRLRSPGVLPLFAEDGSVVSSENYYAYVLLPLSREG